MFGKLLRLTTHRRVSILGALSAYAVGIRAKSRRDLCEPALVGHARQTAVPGKLPATEVPQAHSGSSDRPEHDFVAGQRQFVPSARVVPLRAARNLGRSGAGIFDPITRFIGELAKN